MRAINVRFHHSTLSYSGRIIDDTATTCSIKERKEGPGNSHFKPSSSSNAFDILIVKRVAIKETSAVSIKLKLQVKAINRKKKICFRRNNIKSYIRKVINTTLFIQHLFLSIVCTLTCFFIHFNNCTSRTFFPFFSIHS